MNEELIKRAEEVIGVFQFDTYSKNYAGRVGTALLTKSGKVYTGISLNLVCNLGNCGEHAAVIAMLKERETFVDTIVSCYEGRGIIAPCGRCREMLAQIDSRNPDHTKVIVEAGKIVLLRDLLPQSWSHGWTV